MQAQYDAGQTHGQAQAKAEEWTESCKQKAESAKETMANAIQQAKESETAGFLQQTGEQVRHMAQGPIDGVKNSLGAGQEDSIQRRNC